jgi:hypothetical protein
MGRLARLLAAACTTVVAATAGDSAQVVTFNKDVLPILQRKCQVCHRPGQVAPMAFLTYEGTRPWAKAIKTAVLTRKMPPWSADPQFGRFSNDPTLTASEIDALVGWVDGGVLEGQAKDRPQVVQWHEGWSIRPDVIVGMPKPVEIPAKGVVELTEVTIPNVFKKDTWVTAIEIRPSNQAVVHHADFWVVPHESGVQYGVPRAVPVARDAEGIAIQKVQPEDRLRRLVGFEAVFVPGMAPEDFALHGAAKLIPANGDFVIQVHYTPNGTATTDQTQVAFTLADGTPKRRYITMMPTPPRDEAHFRIPANAADWETRTEVVFQKDAELVWFLPHMHLRGKDMTFRLLYPSGESKTLLSVRFNFNWQFGYDLDRPIQVPKGARLEAIGHYDNSANNKLNPNPARDVFWGDQTWEEMMIPIFGVVVDANVDPKKAVVYSPWVRAAN